MRTLKVFSEEPAIYGTAVSLRIGPDVDFELWSSLAPDIAVQSDAWRWWVGDFLVHGEWKYGERSKAVREQMDAEWDDVRHLVYVAGNVPELIRVPVPMLTWSHHRIVAPRLPDEQKTWLERASLDHWSTRKLHEELQRALQQPADPDEHGHEGGNAGGQRTGDARVHQLPVEKLELTFPADRVERWRYRAAALDLELAEWVGLVLDKEIEADSLEARA